MTEGQSTLERMALAVKNAHTAITVLKKENEGLKLENQSLKDQLAFLQAKLDVCSCGNQKKEAKQKISNPNNTTTISNNWSGGSALKLSTNTEVNAHTTHSLISKESITSETKADAKSAVTTPVVTEAVKGSPKSEKKIISITSNVPVDEKARGLNSKVYVHSSSANSNNAILTEVIRSAALKKPSHDWDFLLSMKLFDYNSNNKKDPVTPASLFGKLSADNYQSVAKGLLRFPGTNINKLISDEIQKWITKVHVDIWKENISKVAALSSRLLPEDLQEKLNLLIQLLLSMCTYSTGPEGYATCLEIIRKLFYLFIASIRLRQGQPWVSMQLGVHEYDSVFAALAYAEHIHAPPSHFFEGASSTIKLPLPGSVQPLVEIIENTTAMKSETIDVGGDERRSLLASMFDFSSDEEDDETEGIANNNANGEDDNESMEVDNEDKDNADESDNQSDEEIESTHTISDEEDDKSVQRNIAFIATDATLNEENELQTDLIETDKSTDSDTIQNYEDHLQIMDIRDYCLFSLILSVWKALGKYDLIKYALHEYSHAVNTGHCIGSTFAILALMHSINTDLSFPMKREREELCKYFQTSIYPAWLSQVESLHHSAQACQQYNKAITEKHFLLHPVKYERIQILIAHRSEQFLHTLKSLYFLSNFSFSSVQGSTPSIGIWEKLVSFGRTTNTVDSHQPTCLDMIYCTQWSTIAKSFQCLLYTYVRNILFPEENLSPVNMGSLLEGKGKEKLSGMIFHSLQEILSFPLTDIIYSKFGYCAGFPQLIETSRMVALSADTAFGNKLTGEEYLSIEWENLLIDSYSLYWYEILSGIKLRSKRHFGEDDEEDDGSETEDAKKANNNDKRATKEEKIYQNVLQSIETLFTFFQENLLIYYDCPYKYSPTVQSTSATSGWRGGNIGEGGQLSNYLKTRLSIMRDFLVKVQSIVQRLRPTSQTKTTTTGVQQTALKQINMYPYFWHYSSVHYADVHDCITMLTHVQDVLFTNYSVYNDEFTPPERQAFHKLRLITMDMIGLLGIAQLERMFFIFISSCRGLFKALRKMLESNLLSSLSPTVLALVRLCIRILEESPNPWGSKYRLDIQYEIISMTEFILEHSHHASKDKDTEKTKDVQSLIPSTTLCQSYQKVYNRYIFKYQKEINAFVINLDRRSDRWKRLLLRVCPSISINLLRISAVDGKYLDPLSVSSEMDGSHMRNSEKSLHEETIIPESDVCTTWDSTLNAKFDSRCIVNEHVPMTPSERACAASHLKIWRMIAAMATSSSSSSSGVVDITSQKVPAKEVEKKRNIKDIAEEEAVMSKKLWTMMHAVSKSAQTTQPVTASMSVTAMQHFFADTSTTTATSTATLSDYYLILEDDASIPANQMKTFTEQLQKLLTKAPENWDILYLGGVTPYRSKFYHEKTMKHGLFYQMNYAWMLHGYVLRRSSAAKLLYHLPINGPVDNFIASLLYDQELIGLLAVEPLIVQVGVSLAQRKEDSNIRHSGVSMLMGQTTANRENFLTSSKIAKAEKGKVGNADNRGVGKKRKKSVSNNNGGRKRNGAKQIV